MEARSAWMSVVHCGTQYLGSAVLINRDGVETMQPLYEDPYGILSLVSRQPLDSSAQSLYPAQKVEAEPMVGWMVSSPNLRVNLLRRVMASHQVRQRRHFETFTNTILDVMEGINAQFLSS